VAAGSAWPFIAVTVFRLPPVMQEKVVPTGFIAKMGSGAELRNALRQPRNSTKYGFGRPISVARAKLVVGVKHGCPVLLAAAVEEFERQEAQEAAKRKVST
jgi:hypothetical protein